MKDKIPDAAAEAEPNGEENENADAPVPSTETGGEGEDDGSVRRSKRLKVGHGENMEPAVAEEVAEEKEQSTKGGENKEPSADQQTPEKPGMTVEEYEAMLDAEAAEWDFPDGM